MVAITALLVVLIAAQVINGYATNRLLGRVSQVEHTACVAAVRAHVRLPVYCRIPG